MTLYTTPGISLEAQYLFRRGREMMEQQKEDTALMFLRQAVFIAPGFSKAYRELGNCLYRLGRSDEASVCYKKAGRIDPGQSGPAQEKNALQTHKEDNPVPGYCLTCILW